MPVQKEKISVNIEGWELELTNPGKTLWSAQQIDKKTYFQYLMKAADRMLPFLKNRLLTVIRYPNGVTGDSFFQKNCPDYAPDFIETYQEDDIRYIVCNSRAALLWLGNQAALEWHVPFSTISVPGVAEVVFDLDPPEKKAFPLAVEAALIMKEIFDRLGLTSFVKTSGGKGLQVYLPLPAGRFSYNDTRKFTRLIAEYLVEKNPRSFTTERLKKNRGHKLYVDYVQHAPGKTIVAPYSPRGNDMALVACPLEWQEVNEQLRPDDFSLPVVLKRIEDKSCPFATFFQVKKQQPFEPILQWLIEHER